MTKKISVLFFISLLFFSCTNLINNSTKTFSYSINPETSQKIKRELTQYRGITEDSLLNVSCALLLEDEVIDLKTTTSTLNDLSSITFSFDFLTCSKEYKIKIDISHENVSLLHATSSSIEILPDEKKEVQILLEPSLFKIKYNLNKGHFDSSDYPTTYRITDTVSLPIPVLSGYKFNGWETPDKTIISEVGRNNFLGDVTLQATWEDVPPSYVTEFTGKTEGGNVTLTWKDPLEEDLKEIKITYGLTYVSPTGKPQYTYEGSKTIKKGDQTITIKVKDTTGSEYYFEAEAIDNNGNTSGACEKFKCIPKVDVAP